jgi:hypothetical protein
MWKGNCSSLHKQWGREEKSYQNRFMEDKILQWDSCYRCCIAFYLFLLQQSVCTRDFVTQKSCEGKKRKSISCQRFYNIQKLSLVMFWNNLWDKYCVWWFTRCCCCWCLHLMRFADRRMSFFSFFWLYEAKMNFSFLYTNIFVNERVSEWGEVRKERNWCKIYTFLARNGKHET